jgi:hypothetical protein
VVTSKSIWQAPSSSSNQLLYDDNTRNIFQSTIGSFGAQDSGKALYSNLVATPAEEPNLINPSPIYPTQLPSYLFEGNQKPGKRLLRTRSTSWSTPYV